MNRRERQELAQEFLRELGRGIPDHERVMVGYAPEATVQTDPETGKKLNGGWWPTPHKDGRHIRDDENCYACISSSIKTANRNGQLRFWRGEASYGHGLALMVDDIGSGKGSKGEFSLADLSSILEPTAVVETSPGNFQCWYFLDEPEPDIKRFKALLVGFVATVLVSRGGDSTIRDVSRYGRSPIGINNKRLGDGQFKYPDGSGVGGVWNVQLRSADYSRRYRVSELAAAFGFNIDNFIPQRRAESESERAQKEDEDKYDRAWFEMAKVILNRAKVGEGTGGEVVENMSGKLRIKCPWGNEHTNGDPFGAYFRGPIDGAEYEYVFGCGHDTCRKDNRRTWSPFVDEVVMPYIEAKLESAARNFWNIPFETIEDK